jgi:hypothetical protein
LQLGTLDEHQQQQLAAAQSYPELRMFVEANEQLDPTDPRIRYMADVLGIYEGWSGGSP